jgi:hypothetical protein
VAVLRDQGKPLQELEKERLEAERRLRDDQKRLEAEQREKERLEAERRQTEEQNRQEHVPQSLSSPIAPPTPPGILEADKVSAETPKVVLPVPPKSSELEREKPVPPSSGGIGRKSPSKQVITFLAVAAVLVVAGLIYVASQSQLERPAPTAAVTPSPAKIATPTVKEKAPLTPQVAVQPTAQPTAPVAMAIPSPSTTPQPTAKPASGFKRPQMPATRTPCTTWAG